ncbi:S8 family peptidase [Piscirickettsia salmonis]|uniref:S8 family peptidase n=1 Tax=Piscirickettsia salmonis TaxID=1238 RepID=UPI003EBE7116
MSDSYPHLRIKKENRENPRRTKSMGFSSNKPDNIYAHGQKLNAYFTKAKKIAEQQLSSIEGEYVLKLCYEGPLKFESLQAHGVEFISQEDRDVCIVFTDNEGLAKFSDHLERLGVNDSDITYKQILQALNGIDNWTPEDRKSWAIAHKGFPSQTEFNLDVELWPISGSSSRPERFKLCENFESWMIKQNIVKLDRVNLNSLVMYRIRVTLEQAEQLLNHRDVRVIDLPPNTGISYQQLNRDINEIPAHIPAPNIKAARICILDSGINTNHPLLKSSIAESKSFVAHEGEFDEAGHGTAVAGIALYGDVEKCNESNFWQPQCWLYNGKLLDSKTEFDEQTIETKLYKAVEYFAKTCDCRIFNISLGNVNAPYDGQHIRGIAYVLDTLAREHDILFVVSAGNFSGSEEPPVPKENWSDEYPEYLLSDASVIIDPAPALNVLTVGSLARHNATNTSQRYPNEIDQLSPASENQPSPFTRHGPSVKGALKPELVAHGGNQATPMRLEGKQWQANQRHLGVLTCHHQFMGNKLFKEISGTSFAAPYITHLAGRVLNEYPDASANLLRAILVNHADLPRETETTFSEEMTANYKKEKATKNREIAREIAGYGLINENTLYRSTESEVVLLAEEKIEDDSHQFFELPLPKSYLRNQKATRELRISLAYSPAVRTTRINYAATKIIYRLVKGKSLEEVQLHFNRDHQDENDFRGDDAINNRTITSSTRDKGTVQSSIWRFHRRNPTDKWFVVVTRQDCDWGKVLSKNQEPYALVITATDRDNVDVQLYTQIQQRIREQEQIRSRV